MLELNASTINSHVNVLKAAVGHLSILNRLPAPIPAEEGGPIGTRQRAHELLGAPNGSWTAEDRAFMANCVVTAVTAP